MIEALAGFYYSASLAKMVIEFYRKCNRAPSAEEGSSMKSEAKHSADLMLAAVPNNTSIAPSIIDVLYNKAGKIDRQICDTLDEPDVFNFEITAWIGNLRRQYCFYIDQTRHFNGGKVPEWAAPVWQDRCCDDGKPIYKHF